MNKGVLEIDEHGVSPRGHKTAHVGMQSLANVGKLDRGVVSVITMWADERVYYPLDVRTLHPGHLRVKKANRTRSSAPNSRLGWNG